MGRGKYAAIAFAMSILFAGSAPYAAAEDPPALTQAELDETERGFAEGNAQALQDEIGLSLYGVTANNNSLPQFSWGIPRSPALTLAGLADTKVPTSDSLRSFVVSLPTTLNNDEQGQAIALDISLSQLSAPEETPTALFQYRGESLLQGGGAPASARTDEGTPYQRWLRRSRIGIALYEGVEDSDPAKAVPARLAFGFSTSLWDQSDPVMQDGPNGHPFMEECTAQVLIANYAPSNAQVANVAPEVSRARSTAALANALGLGNRSLLEAQNFSRASFTASNLTANVASVEQALMSNPSLRNDVLEATEDCAQRASEMAELRRDLDIGIGVLYRGEPGQFSDFDERGAAAWVAFRFPWGVDLVDPDFGERLVSTANDATRGNADSTNPTGNISQYWLVAGSARFGHDEFIATGDAGTPEIRVDQSEAWIGIERYSQDLRFGAFYGYSDVEAAEPAGQPFERSDERYVISAQYRLGRAFGDEDSDLWVGVTYGDTGSAANADNDDALMITFNFAPQPAYTIDWDPND